MEGPLVAATGANGGQQMRPYLVDKGQAAGLTNTDQTQPKVLRTPIGRDAAGQLQQMMESVVDHGTGTKAKIPGFQVGGKTGTAQNSEDDGDHGWFIGFVMKNGDPICAVAVFLQNAGANGSSEATRIGGDVMKTVLHERGLTRTRGGRAGERRHGARRAVQARRADRQRRHGWRLA